MLILFVDEFKYLGHCITDTLKDDDLNVRFETCTLELIC